MRRLAASLLCIAIAAALSAQQTGQNRPKDASDNYTFSVKVQLVVEAVVVKDKQGNPVHGLTAGDFTVTEDNVPQNIRFCGPLSSVTVKSHAVRPCTGLPCG